VGFRRSSDPDVRLVAPRVRGGPWSRLWNALAGAAMARAPRARLTPAAVRAARRVAAPGSLLDWWQGRASFRFPGTWELIDAPGEPPDILHVHNLHGSYFDLRALPELSRRVPLVATLHDPWLLTGHCAYTLGCERWRAGCGSCPHLDTYPALRRDGTAANWIRKRALFAESRIFLASPSRWLLDKVERSMLAPAVLEARVVPNGIDLGVYRPGDRVGIRKAWGVEPEALVVAFVANRFRAPRSWKDWATVREAVALASERLGGRPLHLFAVGDRGDARESVGRARLHAVPHTHDPAEVARFFQGADVVLHAALPEAENYPNVVLEALACGAPVVATAVGGIPEQVHGAFPAEDETLRALNRAEPDAANGTLVPARDPRRMAMAIETLAARPELRARMAQNAAREAAGRHGLDRQVDAYLGWYERILAGRRAC
jgi:glycosyltransferase involved in cell wall biosynthesis